MKINVKQTTADGVAYYQATIDCDGTPCTERVFNTNWIKTFNADTADAARQKAQEHYDRCKGICPTGQGVVSHVQ